MKRPTLSLIVAAPLSAPAPAQPAGATWDGDDLISMMFMSEHADRRRRDQHSGSRHHARGQHHSRYRNLPDDLAGYDEDQRTVVLRLDQARYEDQFGFPHAKPA
ncbi:MAG: hypothetical protein ACOC20_00775 [Oceanicaulis sp.]